MGLSKRKVKVILDLKTFSTDPFHNNISFDSGKSSCHRSRSDVVRCAFVELAIITAQATAARTENSKDVWPGSRAPETFHLSLEGLTRRPAVSSTVKLIVSQSIWVSDKPGTVELEQSP